MRFRSAAPETNGAAFFVSAHREGRPVSRFFGVKLQISICKAAK